MVNCPYDSRPLHDGCYSRVFSAREKLFELSVYLQFLNNPSKATVFHCMNDRGSDLSSAVLREISLSMDCEVFDREVCIIAQTDNFTLQYTAYVARFRLLETKTCAQQLTRMNLNSQIFEYSLGIETLRTTVKLFPNTDVLYTSQYSFVNVKVYNRDHLNKAVVDAPILYCPYVKLNETMLCRVFKLQRPCLAVTGHPFFAKFLQVQYYDFNEYHICINDYIRIMHEIDEKVIELGNMSAAFLPGIHSSTPLSGILFSVVWLLIRGLG